ncbi:MAG: hypothetical protein AAFU60_01185 [Bacteroidota bacterium]
MDQFSHKKEEQQQLKRLKWQLLLVAISSVSVFLACESEPKLPTKAYYYPLDSLYEGVVYEYRSLQQQQDPPFYRYFRTMDQDTAIFLTAMEYDLEYQPFQFVREEIVSSTVSAPTSP